MSLCAARNPRFIPRSRLLLCVLSLLATGQVSAGPADKIYMPSVSSGEFGYELRGGYEDADSGRNPYQGVFDIGYGINDRWALNCRFWES